MLYTSVGDNMRNKKLYKKDRRGIIVSLLIFSFVLMLSVGYSALNEELTISGEAHFRAQSDIRITDVSLYTTTYSALEDYNPSFGKDSMKVGVTLPSNNSSVTYKVTVTNYSNIPMQIKSITKEIENNNYNITFNKALPLTIGKLSEAEIEITFKNNTNTSQTINANLLFTFAKLESMMTTGNSTNSTSTFYNGPLTKDSIKTITFMSTKEIPEDAIGYWDCSYNAGSNEVMAYYLNSETEGMYDLYIAADGEVYAPSSSSNLFMNFINVTSINFNDSFNTSKVTQMGARNLGMFIACSKLTKLDLTNFNTENVTDMQNMFNNCSKLASLVISNFNTNNVVNMQAMFKYCSLLKTLDLSNFNTENVTTMYEMFSQCNKLESIVLSSEFDTSKVTVMGSMFYNNGLLKNVDVSNFIVNNVKNFNSMFYGCSGITSLDVSGWETISATDMGNMFAGVQVASLDLSRFDTSEVTNMSKMFRSCYNLKNLDISNFDTSNVSNMTEMFAYCYALENLNISSFTTESLTNITQMFYYCHKIKNIDMRNMDFENKNITTTNIFAITFSGTNIYVLNEYNKTFIQGLNSNANVIIYVQPEEEEIEES